MSGLCFISDKLSTVRVTGNFRCPTTRLFTPSIMNFEDCFTYLNMLDMLLYEPAGESNHYKESMSVNNIGHNNNEL